MYSRKKTPPQTKDFSYKQPETLLGYLTESGKIVPRRVARLSAKQQRRLQSEIKRARTLALLPFAVTHIVGRPVVR